MLKADVTVGEGFLVIADIEGVLHEGEDFLNGFGFGLVGPDDTTRTLSARYYKDGSEILVDRGREGNPRRLTPRECARLMGFPDRFRIVVSDTQAYKQFGNSVVVPLMEYAARAMKPHVMRMKAERPHSVGRTFRGAS